MKALAVHVMVGLVLGGAVACGGIAASRDSTSPPPDAGDGTDTADADGAADAARGPYDTPVTCTSGTTWTNPNAGSTSMSPGRPCVACHTTTGGPHYWVAGTIYPTAHEPDDCNGLGRTPENDLKVVVTDANGTVTVIVPNSVGNFFSRSVLVLPFHASVVSGTRTRACPLALTSGDCNACHTEQGTSSAPGRIVAP